MDEHSIVEEIFENFGYIEFDYNGIEDEEFKSYSKIMYKKYLVDCEIIPNPGSSCPTIRYWGIINALVTIAMDEYFEEKSRAMKFIVRV